MSSLRKAGPDGKDVRRGKYRHYKGKLYEVIDVARHSETLEELVVYRTLYANEKGEQTLWVRPLSMFTEDVVVEDSLVPRFQWCEEHSPDMA